MDTFLSRFAMVVWGVLSGFDRVVFKGWLPQLYSPEGMNCYASANHVRLLDFKQHAKGVTAQVMASSLVEQAKADGWFEYLNSSAVSKDKAARAILKRCPTNKGVGSRIAVRRAVLDIRHEEHERSADHSRRVRQVFIAVPLLRQIWRACSGRSWPGIASRTLPKS